MSYYQKKGAGYIFENVSGPFCLTVVRSRTLLFSSVIALMAFTGYFFRDSLANAFGLIIMGFLLIALSAVAMSLNRKYIQAKPAD